MTARIISTEAGFSLLDVLVSVVLSAILALGITKSTILSTNMSQKAYVDSVATQLAIEALEANAQIDPSTLDNSDDTANVAITRNGISFTRDVDITIATDRTREIAVTVRSTRQNIATSVRLTSGYALWGER